MNTKLVLESFMTTRPGLNAGFCWDYPRFHFFLVLFDIVFVVSLFFIFE